MKGWSTEYLIGEGLTYLFYLGRAGRGQTTRRGEHGLSSSLGGSWGMVPIEILVVLGVLRSILRHTELLVIVIRMNHLMSHFEVAHQVAHPYHHRSLSYWNWNHHHELHVLGSIPSACTTHARP